MREVRKRIVSNSRSDARPRKGNRKMLWSFGIVEVDEIRGFDIGVYLWHHLPAKTTCVSTH